jgi:hypothetical protein
MHATPKMEDHLFQGLDIKMPGSRTRNASVDSAAVRDRPGSDPSIDIFVNDDFSKYYLSNDVG